MKKKIVSAILTVLLCAGTFAFAQLAIAGEVYTTFNVTLSPNGINKTILTGAKNDARKNYSTISLTGGSVDHINAWIVNSKGKMISEYKYKVPMGTRDKHLNYKQETSVSNGTTTSIVIEQNNIKSKTAQGNANLK